MNDPNFVDYIFWTNGWLRNSVKTNLVPWRWTLHGPMKVPGKVTWCELFFAQLVEHGLTCGRNQFDNEINWGGKRRRTGFFDVIWTLDSRCDSRRGLRLVSQLLYDRACDFSCVGLGLISVIEIFFVAVIPPYPWRTYSKVLNGGLEMQF